MISFVKAFMSHVFTSNSPEKHMIVSEPVLRKIIKAAVDEGRLIERLALPHTGINYSLTGNTIGSYNSDSGRLEDEIEFSIEFPTDNDAMIYKLSKETKDDQ